MRLDFPAVWTFCKGTGNARWRPTRKRFLRSPRQLRLYTPTRVLQGILYATSYFQVTLARVLERFNCMVRVDDVIYWGLDETDLLNTLDLILKHLEVGLYAAAHKCNISRLASHITYMV